jgi:Flp pilus assembly protein TadG
MMSSLVACRRGTAALEFALVAPIMVLMVVGVVPGGANSKHAVAGVRAPGGGLF